MTKKLQASVLGLMVAANVDAARGRALKLVSSKPAKSGSRTTRPRSWKFVPAEDILFAEMDESVSVMAFTDDEIERIGIKLGLSSDELAALYKP
ncbi:MAG TPA: hypothetical protein VK777_15250 [Reyranella sp.]|jgi:hypothetical protein|nr:hypothetical protein [Reyranella sp.]